jgi:hypothetical protein
MAEVPPSGSVAPTGWQAIGVALVAGAGVGWSVFSALDIFGAPLPQLPLAVTLLIAVLAALIGAQAAVTHRAIQVRRQRIAARRAVALLVLGKAALLTGAGLAGGYLAIAAYSWTRQDATLPRERVISSAVAVVASVALAAAGAFLERSCRIPGPPNEDATPPTIQPSSDNEP